MFALETLFEIKRPPRFPRQLLVGGERRTVDELRRLRDGKKVMAYYCPSKDKRDGSYALVTRTAKQYVLTVTVADMGHALNVYVTKKREVWRARAHLCLDDAVTESGTWTGTAELLTSLLLGYSRRQRRRWVQYHAWKDALSTASP